ncbi:MAG TPA: hypothetical protein PLI95_14895 [Polyangiaceae bacterium]|nr:hypothetical protein [Polyangiaceae bacterium]
MASSQRALLLASQLRPPSSVGLAGGSRPLHAIIVAACLSAFGHVLGNSNGLHIGPARRLLLTTP